MKRKLMLAGLLLVSFSGFAAEREVDWSYEGQEGPANWGKLSPDFSLCEIGKNQSPVNIQGALETTHHDKLKLTFKPGKQEIVNNGHTIQVNVNGEDALQIDNDTFTLQQFHFHVPAENEIDGKRYPLEAHFVYKAKDDALVVLALLFQEGKANPQLANAWQHMPAEPAQTAVLSKPVDIRALLPEQLNFYRFSGSLTTPPCSEGVRWIVLEQPVNVSAEQIKQFSAAIRHTNNRPVQPLNGRIIVN